jgi:hypothetical protein
MNDFSDQIEDFRGLRGGYVALKRVDTSKYDQAFGKPRIARLKDIAQGIGRTELQIQGAARKVLESFEHLRKPNSPDPRFKPMHYGI